MTPEEHAKLLAFYKHRLGELHGKWIPKAHQAKIINAIFGQEKRKRVFIRGGRNQVRLSLFCM